MSTPNPTHPADAIETPEPARLAPAGFDPATGEPVAAPVVATGGNVTGYDPETGAPIYAPEYEILGYNPVTGEAMYAPVPLSELNVRHSSTNTVASAGEMPPGGHGS